MKTVNVAIIGHNFMGRAHSNAWTDANKFFDVPLRPVLKVACGRDQASLQQFARTWGWQETETEWRRVVERADIDIVDISTPTYLHKDMAVAAAQAGKAVFCEKPMAMSVAEAHEMLQAAEKAGVLHYLNHNYRRVPAVTFARKLIDDGKIGDIYHWRGAYLQDGLMNPAQPLTWRLRKEVAGGGPLFDLGSHSVDLARYLVGEIKFVAAMTTQFIPQRPVPNAASGDEQGRVTVEDAALLIAEFECGALGMFETSKFAGGRKNYNAFEIYGSKGSLGFNLERMNELQLLSQDDAVVEQGFRAVLMTSRNHPYMAGWWPPGHIIGYEHTFTHAVVDFLHALDKGTDIAPNFRDGVKVMRVLEAGLKAAETGCRVEVSETSV